MKKNLRENIKSVIDERVSLQTDLMKINEEQGIQRENGYVLEGDLSKLEDERRKLLEGGLHRSRIDKLLGRGGTDAAPRLAELSAEIEAIQGRIQENAEYREALSEREAAIRGALKYKDAVPQVRDFLNSAPEVIALVHYTHEALRAFLYGSQVLSSLTKRTLISPSELPDCLGVTSYAFGDLVRNDRIRAGLKDLTSGFPDWLGAVDRLHNDADAKLPSGKNTSDSLF